MNIRKKIYFIIGPTASGKTSLSIELAKKIKSESGVDCEIISCDSRQIFRDLNLSTGKITELEKENIPHHMIDIINPREYFSVVDYTKMTLEIIKEIYKRGNIPIIVGGTGFYVDSLLYDYNLPEVKANPKLRDELSKKTKTESYEILKKLDNTFAEKHNTLDYKNNPHRMMRAIEIATQLGKVPPLKKIERFNKKEYDVEFIFTKISQEDLRQNIYKRLLQRIESGMIDEIKSVKEKYNLSFEYLEKLGLEFKWVSKYLQNQTSYDEMVQKLYVDICHYAKRQNTWFKRYNKI